MKKLLNRLGRRNQKFQFCDPQIPLKGFGSSMGPIIV